MHVHINLHSFTLQYMLQGHSVIDKEHVQVLHLCLEMNVYGASW